MTLHHLGLVAYGQHAYQEAVAMSEAMGRAWLRHNVEEVGNFERFLPGLYERWLASGDAVLDSAESAGAPA